MAANPQVINTLGQDQQAFMFYIFKKLTDLGIVNAELMDKNKNEDYYVRWKANEILMIRAGILRENISISNICTHCNSNLLFSHRKQGDDRGNLAAFLALK